MTGVTTAGPRPRAEQRTAGVLSLNKPAGITSFDAVREVRRIYGERRVGHAGTLDPTASGLLPICLGRATRLVDYFHAQPKTYHCVVRLGERSDTFDLEGTVTPGADASALSEASVRAALGAFSGDILQVPPMHSAVRHEGRHLYELARQGREVQREPRQATIHALELLAFRPGRVAEAELMVTSGKGAYMRVLAHDLGEALGTGGLLGWLSRTRYGSLTLDGAVQLAELAAMEDPREALLGMEVAVAHLARADLGPAQAQQLRRGQAVWLPRGQQPADGTECAGMTPDGRLVAIGEVQGGLFRPTKVLA
ncbi:MAG: tRNA pseudouridine(55) synthase TruB [Candidatus Dormibacteraeota bacterium]|nr:tRNA pseudouridine(55) synthase TruB [Candidatus Dormibacteraeota bacterium]MBV9525731.1 tRNA pseudouridine(55) synthase TruB [Candidatus Dormibacteraeota bacterium]